MIIGDSILKGITHRGLQSDVEIRTNRGATSKEILEKLKQTDLKKYANVVVYVGGNDASRGKTTNTFAREIRDIIDYIRVQNCKPQVCLICPRSDVDVVPFNDIINQVANEKAVEVVDCYTSFIYGTGMTATHYFLRDGIHLSPKGTSRLLQCIQKSNNIIRQRFERRHDEVSSRRINTFSQHTRRSLAFEHGDRRGNRHSPQKRQCQNCGRFNHSSQECRALNW